jgi:thiol-disulfide isomerase/thioredoxin
MEITSELLKEKIKNGEKLMVDFWGSFCGPCKVMKPMYEKASEMVKESGSPVSLYIFNIEDDMDYMRELGIRGVPTIKGFSDGKEVFSEVGLKQTNAILEMVDKLS